MKRLLALVAIVLLAAGCTGKADKAQSGAPLNLSTTFSPDPPKQGSETITVTLTDANGAPVKGADVKISTTMPAMSMTGPTVTGSDNGDGTYTAHMMVNYATGWQFAVSAAANGTRATSTVSRDVP